VNPPRSPVRPQTAAVHAVPAASPGQQVKVHSRRRVATIVLRHINRD